MAYHERKGRHDLSSYGKINKSIAVKAEQSQRFLVHRFE